MNRLIFFAKQARYILKIWQMDAHEIGKIDEQFDLVMLTGILYYLKDPLQVLEDVGHRCRDAIIVEAEILLEDSPNLIIARVGLLGKVKIIATIKGLMKFYERDELNGDASNWWLPDTEYLLGMLRVADFKYFSRPIYHTQARVLLIATKNNQSLLDWRKL